jgi:hypothetical protein
MKKLSKRTIASRANGKLSHGPVTSAGLLRASANSTRHGLLAKSVLVGSEDPETFAVLHQQYIDRINPTDGIEITLVEELATTVWRQGRLRAFETDLLNQAANRHAGPGSRATAAFAELCRGPELHLIDRYESRLHRMFQRTLKNIQLIRQIEHTDPSTGELTQFPLHNAPAPAEHPPTIPKIQELPNEPRSEQRTVESEPYPTTLNPQSESPVAPDSPSAPIPSAPPQPVDTTKIHELPNEPRSEQPAAESTRYPETSTSKFEPVSNPVFSVDPRTGQFRRIA